MAINRAFVIIVPAATVRVVCQVTSGLRLFADEHYRVLARKVLAQFCRNRYSVSVIGLFYRCLC